MAKSVIVIVETDKNYLSPIEMKMAETLMDSVDIEIISDTDYFEEYFIVPKKIDILVIDQKLYSERLSMHSIGKTFILTEEMNETEDYAYRGESTSSETIYLFKYCNVSTLVNYIIPTEWAGAGANNVKEPQLIAVLSPSGGTGVTTVAMGISACMKQNLKKALYINLNRYQNFHYYLQNKTTLSMEACSVLRDSDARIYENMKKYLEKEDFVYLPPLKNTRDSLGISKKSFMELALTAKKSGDFDFVIVDIGSDLTGDELKFMKYVNKALVVVNQDPYALFKLEVLKCSVDCSDTEKYLFLCNNFEKDKENGLSGALVVSEYIEKDGEKVAGGCKQIKTIEGIQRAAYMLL